RVMNDGAREDTSAQKEKQPFQLHILENEKPQKTDHVDAYQELSQAAADGLAVAREQCVEPGSHTQRGSNIADVKEEEDHSRPAPQCDSHRPEDQHQSGRDAEFLKPSRLGV